MNKEIVRLKKEDAVLVVVDYQTKLMPAIYEKELVEDRTVRMIKGCRALGVPAVVTQQYTRGLGETIPGVAEALGEFEPIEKVTFSCWGEENFRAAVEQTGRKTVLLTGVEAHICVEQTALDLLENGYQVVLICDCVQSRDPENKKIAMKRMRDAGAVLDTYESVLYQLMETSKAPEFKAISAIVK